MSGPLPANDFPVLALANPSASLPAGQPIVGNLYHGPMLLAQTEVIFDPSTPPPFADRAQMQTPRRHGVLKITNIPYTISIPEMHQFIGKYLPMSHLIDAHILGYPTHIIMERSTGKTMDCYMEIKSPEMAAADWEHAFGTKQMRIPKIGQRNVEVSLSSHAELMKDIFPRAKCIVWDDDENGSPKLIPNRDIYSSGFNGFITTEELTCMARHAEYPQRSQFAARSMHRAYECMISTTYKFPWYAATLYTMRHVQEIFKTYKRQLDHLIGRLTSPGMQREVGLDNKLLMDLIFAGLNTPGFSERQKGLIADTCIVLGTGFPVSKHARTWPFQTLSVHPHQLSEQDVAMWLDVFSIGVAVIESQNRPFIGISSFLRVIRDSNAHILFVPTEEGLDLKRAQFAILELKMLSTIMEYGWNVYLPQMGIDPTTLFDSPTTQAIKNSLVEDNAPVGPVTPPAFVGNSTTLTETGAYVVDDSGHREPATDNVASDNIEDDFEFIQAGATGVSSDSFNDPEQALAAMRQVVDEVREAPPAEQDSHANLGRADFSPEANGSGAGQNEIVAGNVNDAPVARYVPPARRTSNYGAVLLAPTLPPPNLNPESPPFEPTRAYTYPLGHAPYLPVATAFAGPGLGNGDFTTSPARISTRRVPSIHSHDGGDKGKGKESALSSPAARVRLQPAPFLGQSAPILGAASGFSAGQGQVFPQGQILTYGQPQGMTYGQPQGPTAQYLQGLAANAAQRHGIEMRDPNNGNLFSTLRPAAPIGSTTGNVTAGIGNGSIPPGTGPPLYLPRTRPGPTVVPNHGTDGTGRTFDDTLDDWFAESTDEPTRMAILAGMNMRTASASTLVPPTTPPPAYAIPNARLRRSPGREHLHTTYEFDQDLHMSQAEGMPFGRVGPSVPTTFARPFGSYTSAPSTPARGALRSPIRNVPRTPGSGPLRGAASSEDPDTSGGVRDPGSLMRNSWTIRSPVDNIRYRNVGVIGDGSPLRRVNAAAAAGRAGPLGTTAATASTASSPAPMSSQPSLPQLYTTTETTAQEHARRVAMHRERMLRQYIIDEEEDSD
ncbi:hypothetical protein A1O7_03386 [Cladophialophora yegresii CBS 114405]|uniref:Uncharacterized protein n=1 Tax=Cladophialophora yegresii CBS 114405 TaxID=1182544 RepID=W9W4D9_9EURO|nr:uncharacterized protein A1O7_03386 [Cladophialophora yegresii CBS 114405]EXJ62942.1 hypothetical protein A1O7_03386 [Cladophialophora yegresii CBS 114405]